MTEHEEKAAEFLLGILATEPIIRYSRFYGTAEARESLIKGIGMTEEEADWYSAEGTMDDAVFELVQQGVVTKTDLAEKLIDGEPDYEIRLVK